MSVSSRLAFAKDMIRLIEDLPPGDDTVKQHFKCAVAVYLDRLSAELRTPTWVVVPHEEIQRPEFLEPISLTPISRRSSDTPPILSTVPEEQEEAPAPVSVPVSVSVERQAAAEKQEDSRSVAQETATTNGSRRDFTKFCRTLGLPAGHSFTLMKGSSVESTFHLSYVAGKAMLFIDCQDGTRLSANSPSGIVQRYIRKVKGKIVSINGWDKLNMQWNRTNTFFPISNTIWDNCSWDPERSSFRHDA
jgi:hypothetical protein